MATNNLEDELRNLRFIHLTESELAAYSDKDLDQTRRALAEAHLKQCFICERQLVLLREESDALDNRATTAEDVAIVERRASQELVGSRAGGLHSRTIEIFDQRGIADRKSVV